MSETLPNAAAAPAPVNPLLVAWQTPFETPPFSQIAPEHFIPAFEQAFVDHAAEITAIEHDPSAPDFANTITALERSGKLLAKVSAVFYDLVSAHSNPALLEIDKEVSLRMARHWNPIMMNAVLFGRIAMLHHNRATLALTGEQMRLLERTYTRFHRSGAGLDDAAKARMAEINERLEHSMAKTPEAVRGLLERVWKPARARALRDRDDMQGLVAEEGGNFALAPWDWRYYAEKLRQRRANFDDAAIKPYLVLDHIIEAAFDTAHRLFGVSFSERKDIPVWHPDVRVWEVKDAAGQHKALFYGDYFARPSKRSGAWMTSLRDQQKLDGDIYPLIINVCNFAKGADGQPSLLSPDDARTLFHEFGHGLHGMLSNITYPSLSGTSVFTDFVELPSQLYEHWQEQPEVLRQFARHYQTGEPLPDDLLQRFLAARKFNQGFATVEFVSSALIDLEFHTQPASASRDVGAFEKAELEKIGMPAEIALRHRPTQFGHIFSGDHYASGYYSYMWSEVMDADAFGAFEEAGNIFDTATAKRLHDDIYSSGGSRDPEEAYVAFRGREPEADALLRRRGLLEASEAA